MNSTNNDILLIIGVFGRQKIKKKEKKLPGFFSIVSRLPLHHVSITCNAKYCQELSDLCLCSITVWVEKHKFSNDGLLNIRPRMIVALKQVILSVHYIKTAQKLNCYWTISHKSTCVHAS